MPIGIKFKTEAERKEGKRLANARFALTEKGIGWVDEHVASTEGSSIYLPVVMEQYSSKEENFASLKVFVTHQAAHLEFGSFNFDLQKPATIFENLRDGLIKDAEPIGTAFTTPFERFFDLFRIRQLASDLYEISEDARIDAAIKREYGGIRKALNRIQGEEMLKRPKISELPLRQAFVENLLRVSLDGLDAVMWPKNKMEVMGKGIAILARLTDKSATVEDASEATLRLYNIAAKIPNEKVDDDIFVLLESRRKEWDADLKELHSRITTNTRELREHTISSEKRLLIEMRAIRGELSNRVGILEKWRWIIIGGAIVVGLIFTDARDSILDLFN